MNKKPMRQHGCRVMYGFVAIGKIIYYDNQNETEKLKESEIEELFSEITDNTIDEYIQYREIKAAISDNEKRIYLILDFIFRTFDTEIIKINFINFVAKEKLNISKAFERAFDEYMLNTPNLVPSDLAVYQEEIVLYSKELKQRLIMRYEVIMLQRLIKNIDFDFILFIKEFKKEYLYNLPKRIQAIICRNIKDEQLGISLAHEYELPLVIHDYNYKEQSIVIIDGKLNQVLINPSDETLDEYKEMTQIQTYKNGENPSYLPSKVNIYAPMVDTRMLDKVASGRWYSGIAPYKTEFMYVTKGMTPSYTEQYGIFLNVLDSMKNKEVYISIPDFRPEKPTEYLGEIFTDMQTFSDFTNLFSTNLLAIAHASRDTNKAVNIVVPMIRMSEEVNQWRNEIEAVFEYCRVHTVKIGIMIETESAFEYYDEYKDMDFAIIGLNNLIEEITDDFDRYSHLSKEEIIDILWPDVRDLHQYLRSYKLQVKHILSGNFLTNPDVFRKFLKSGFTDFSIPISKIKIVEQVLKDHVESKGKCVGLAAQRVEKTKLWKISRILKEKKEREDKKKKAEEKIRKKQEKIQQERDKNKEKREQVIKMLLSSNKKNNNNDENDGNE
ncbi:MAG: putative PEP-binding protein [Bacillota bacterium]